MYSLVSFGILILGFSGFCWFIVPQLYRGYREARLRRICRKGRIIVLSYDDGPGTKATPAILDTLAAHGVPASFFVLGRNVEAHPELAARVLENGHEMGSHTRNHTNDWKTWPPQSARDRMNGVALVNRLGGHGCLFRPPFGKMTMASWVSAKTNRLRLAWWTLDSRDSWQRRPIEAVLNDLEAAGGGVVLMHDGDAYEKSGPGHAAYVLELTDRIIALAEAGEYRIMRMGELLDQDTARHG